MMSRTMGSPAGEQDGELEFAGPAILRPLSHARAEWAETFAAISIESRH
jgi:hypothetical protein